MPSNLTTLLNSYTNTLMNYSNPPPILLPAVYGLHLAAHGSRLTVSRILPLLAFLLFSGCARRPNVLILTLDTTRADRLGCYGYALADTPGLDRLAAEGALFERAQAVMPITLPTHATIFTGYLPLEHGLRVNRDYALPPEIPTLASQFKQAGYDTAAVVASKVLDSKYGLSRGFDTYVDAPAEIKKRPAAEVSSLLLEWLEGRRRAPFFVWAHYFDPHMPRLPHPELSGLKSSDPYDIEIAYMDRQISRLLEYLDRQGLARDTLVVAVADHGEGLGEHGEERHGHLIYQSTQHVPLILRWPGKIKPGRRIVGSVSQTDLMPTILELAGLPAPRYGMGGLPKKPLLAASFAAALLKDTPFISRPCHMEALWTYTHFNWSPLAGLVEGRWSYIFAPAPELYDLDADPAQRSDLVAAQPRRADELGMLLDGIEQKVEIQKPTEKVDVSPEEIRKFAALGYLAGRKDAVAQMPARHSLTNLPDPKTKLQYYTRAEPPVLHGRFSCRQRPARGLPADGGRISRKGAFHDPDRPRLPRAR